MENQLMMLSLSIQHDDLLEQDMVNTVRKEIMTFQPLAPIYFQVMVT
jgi:hypothetical protein